MLLRTLLPGLMIAILNGTLLAQGPMGVPLAGPTGQYYPLDHRQAPGVAAQWQMTVKRGLYGYMQPVRLIMPGTAKVSYYNGSPQAEVVTDAPSQVRMMVGHVYRLKLSEIAGYPGVELYPTIEVLDRLHPPEGKLDQFPIPIELTEEEIAAAVEERLVTKVLYLEQPDIATPVSDDARTRVEELDQRLNLLEAADVRGRPMAILRIGGRIPDPAAPQDEFFSSSPLLLTPAVVSEPTPIAPAPR
jgi:hypothetical protein